MEVTKSLKLLPSTSISEENIEICILKYNRVLHVLSQVVYIYGTFCLSNRKVETKKKNKCNSQFKAIIQKMYINCETRYTLCIMLIAL